MTKLTFFERLSIRWCVGSEQGPCGCTVGFYETYHGEVLSVIDARGIDCPYPLHDKNRVFRQPATPSWMTGRNL